MQRVLLREDKSDPIAFAVVFQVITAAFIAVYAFAIHAIHMPDIVPALPNLLLMTVLYSLGNFFLYTSLKQIEASKCTILFASRALFTVLASTVILHEALRVGQWFGALCIFAGIILVAGRVKRRTFAQGEWFALFAAVCYGFAVTNDRFILQSLPLYTYVILVFILPAIGTIFINMRSVLNIKSLLSKKKIWKMLILCFVYAVQAVTFYNGLHMSSNSSQVSMMNVTAVILTVVLSILILKERADWPKKVIGAVLSFIGLLLVS
jgi:drug/metabolite transporter (DMT)-like permease